MEISRVKCTCPTEYIQIKPKEHTQRCYDAALDEFEKEIELALKRRIDWETTPFECHFPVKHQPHGNCSGGNL